MLLILSRNFLEVLVVMKMMMMMTWREKQERVDYYDAIVFVVVVFFIDEMRIKKSVDCCEFYRHV